MLCNNNVIITLKRRRFEAMVTLLLRRVSVGYTALAGVDVQMPMTALFCIRPNQSQNIWQHNQ